jgi:hypothetical protein
VPLTLSSSSSVGAAGWSEDEWSGRASLAVDSRSFPPSLCRCRIRSRVWFAYMVFWRDAMEFSVLRGGVALHGRA